MYTPAQYDFSCSKQEVVNQHSLNVALTRKTHYIIKYNSKWMQCRRTDVVHPGWTV